MRRCGDGADKGTERLGFHLRRNHHRAFYAQGNSAGDRRGTCRQAADPNCIAGAPTFRSASNVPAWSAEGRQECRRSYYSFFFASSGTLTVVSPTSFISTVVVRLTSTSRL